MNSTQRGSAQLISSLIFLLFLVYVVNAFTPLRLTFDTVRYFKIKEWIEAGRPAGVDAATDFLPAGYVWFLYLLEKLGIAVSPVISFIQLIYFVAGSYFFSKINGNRKYFPLILVVCMFSWTVLKFVITPLSEMQFIFLTSMSLFFFYRWEKFKKVFDMLLCIVFTAMAVYTRTAGLSLVIAGMLYFVITRYSLLFPEGRRFPAVWVVILLLGVVSSMIFTDVIHVNEYFQFLISHFEYGVGYTLSRNAWFHLVDFGSLFLNMPAGKVPFMPQMVTNSLFAITGFGFLCLATYLLVSRKASMHLMLRLYTGVYLLMIFNWPYYEPRFFVPVVPVITVLLIRNFPVFPSLVKNALKLYLVFYALIGTAAIGYYTYTSLNREALSQKQDAGIWRNEYETYFFGKPLSDTATVVRKPIVELLKKYN
jgi:hypothetical protein